jgi:hypothetical protein
MSPSVQDYDIYCDETYIHGPIAFAFGALVCTPTRSELLRKQLEDLRQHHNYYNEVKWTTLSSNQKLVLYQKFVDVFFDDKFSKFMVRRVEKGQFWYTFGKTEEERFFKAYHHFLKRWVGPFSRYRIYPDKKPLQRNYRWDTLYFLINRSRRHAWGLRRRNISIFEPTNSADKDLLQLTDILLGGLTSTAVSKAKKSLRAHLLSRSEGKTQSGSPKITVETWTPRIRTHRSLI